MSKRWKALIGTAGVLVPSLTGCGGSSSSDTSAPALMPRSVATTLSNGLTAKLAEDRSTISVDGSVTYTLTLTNSTTQPITFQPTFGPNDVSGVSGSILLTDPSGKSEPAAGISVTPIGGTGPAMTLAPGQSVSGTEVVGNSTAYTYSLLGPYTATASFRVVQGGTTTSFGMEIDAMTGPLVVTAQ